MYSIHHDACSIMLHTSLTCCQQEGGHGARAGSNDRNLNFNGHSGALNEYNNNNNGYSKTNGYSNKGFNPQNERYGLENDQSGEFSQHNLNLNVLPIDPVTETAVR